MSEEMDTMNSSIAAEIAKTEQKPAIDSGVHICTPFLAGRITQFIVGEMNH
jgi:hypothetical protein